MESNSELCSCTRDSDYWDSIRSGFEEQSSRDREEELMPNANDSSSDLSACVNEPDVPKVFPKRLQNTKNEGTNTQMMWTYEKKETTSSFFNKIMENAKSILSMKCSVIHPSAPLNEEPTKDTEDTCVCETWPTSTSRAPYDTCIEKSETCFCEDKTTDNSYSQEYSAGSNSCSCCRTPTSGTPKFFKASSITPDPLVNDKSDKQIQFEIQKRSRACSCGRSTVSDQVQTVPQPPRDLVSCACATSASLASGLKRNRSCPCERKIEKTTSAQQYSRENTSVDNAVVGTNTSRQATTIWTNAPKGPSNMAKSASEASKPNRSPNVAQKRKSCNSSNCPSAKRVRSTSKIRDIKHENNQSASDGSPGLKTTFAAQQAKVPNTKNFGCCCNNTNSAQLVQMLSDLASQEKGIKNQLNDLIEREKNYDALLSNLQRNAKSEKSCSCKNKHEDPPKSDFETVSHELRMENCRLKSDLMEMKLELKHCIEKVEGPMKAKLEAEKAKCICLQNELSKASQNMVITQDMYEREMNSLKLQLCIACSNMTELNGINKRLQDELSSLDCLCVKLEEDLMKQKLSEAETIKRLKKRCPDVGESPKQKTNDTVTPKETFKCDSNLHVIARKLSKTLKDSAPCEECSKLPEELTNAAKCIRDLTDMVESRKVAKPDGDGLKKDSFSQSLPRTETVCCQCTELRDIGAGESVTTSAVQHKVDVTTVFSAPPKAFLDGQESAQGMQLLDTTSGAEPVDAVKSKYFDAQGDPGRPVCPETGDEPCSEPCLHEDAACDPMRPCAQTAEAPKKQSPTPAGEVQQDLRGQVLQSVVPSEQVNPPPCPPSCYVDGVPCPRQIDAGVPAAPVKPTVDSATAIASETTENVLKRVEEINQAKQSEEPVSDMPSKVSEAGDKVELREGEKAEQPIKATAEIAESQKLDKMSQNEEGSQLEEPSKPYESAEPNSGGEPPAKAIPSANAEPSVSATPSQSVKSSGEPADAPKDPVPFTIVEEEEGNFPFAVTARGEVLSEPPTGLNVTTVITTSGNLEVITEGPQGLIETTLNYNEEDGTIEVITEISEIPKESETSSHPSSAVTELSKTKSALSKKSDVRSDDAKITFDGQKLEPAKAAVEKESMVSATPGLTETETEQSIRAGISTEPSIGTTSVSVSESSKAIPPTEQEVPTIQGSPSTQQGDAPPDLKTSQVRNGQKEQTEVHVAAAEGPREEKVLIDQLAPTEISTAMEQTSKSSKLETTTSDTFPKSTGSELMSTEISTATEKTSQKDQSEETEPSGYTKSTGSEMTSAVKAEMSTGPSTTIETTEKSSGLETDAQKESGVQRGSDLILTTDLESVPSAKPMEQSHPTQEELETPAVEAKRGEGQGEEVATNGTDRPEEERSATSASERKMRGEIPDRLSAKTSAVADRQSKKSVPEQCAEQPLKGQKRDCACQSRPQTEQSCQCCECKDVGVPSSQDTETITEDKMTHEKLPPDASEHAPPTQFQQPYPPRDSQKVDEGRPIGIKDKISRDDSRGDAVADRPEGGLKSTGSVIMDQTSRSAEVADSAIRKRSSREGKVTDSPVKEKGSRDVVGVGSAIRDRASKDANLTHPATGSHEGRGAEGVRSQASREAEGIDSAIADRTSREAKPTHPTTGSQEGRGAEGVRSQASRDVEGVGSAIRDRASNEANLTHPTTGSREGRGAEGVRSQASRKAEGIDSVIADRASREAKPTHPTTGSQEGRGAEGVRRQASGEAKEVDSSSGARATREPKGSDLGIRHRASKGPEGVDSTVKPEVAKDLDAYDSAVGDQTITGKGSKILDSPVKGQIGKDSAAKVEGVSPDLPVKDGTSRDLAERADSAAEERPSKAQAIKEGPSRDKEITAEGKLATLDEVDEFKDALGPTTVTVRSGRDERDEITADKEAATVEGETISKGVQKSPEEEVGVSIDEDLSGPQDASETRFMDAATSDQPPLRPSTKSDGDGPRKTDVSEPLEEFVSAQEVLEEGEAAATTPTPVSSKGSKKEAKLKRSSEVPDSVSKLSDKVMLPVRSDGSDPKRPKKKRSPKFDGFKCECHDICNCTICCPEIIARRIQQTGSPYPAESVQGQICCCAGRPAPPVPDCKKPCPAQVYLQTQATKRPAVCGARRPPVTEALLRSTNLDVSESKSKKRISIDDVFVQKKCDAETSCGTTPKKKAARCPGCVPRECQVDCVPAPQTTNDCQTDAPGTSAGSRLSPFERQSHPSNCECVDCLCFPKIQELAQTVEFPIVKDQKQIYQVRSMKCNCANAQNAKKLLERTKIPLPTTSSGRPPKIKISPVGSASCDCDVCACAPCADPKKAAVLTKPSSEQRSQQPVEENVDLSKLCDCKDCKCERCFNKPPKTESKPQTKSNKNCCCPGECSCPVCPTETLQKQLDEEKSKAAQMAQMSKQPSAVSKQVSQAPHSDDCDCSICACPNAPSKTPAIPPTTSVTEKQIKELSYDHPEDCDCSTCACPGAASKQPETATPPPPPPPVAAPPQAPAQPSSDHPEDCTCPECVDCPEALAKKRKTEMTPKPSEPAKGRPPDCECGEVCSCPGGPTPGARGDQAPPPPKESQHKPKCDCATCKCTPCPDKETVPQPQPTEAKAQVIAACDCPGVCACAPCADPSKQKQQQVVSAKPSARGEQPTPGVCNCGTCTCPPKESIFSLEKAPLMSHPAKCTCATCECPNKDKVKEQAEQTCREVEHPLDCDCAECDCYSTQFSDARVGTTDAKSTHADQPECDCDKCICPHLEGGIDVGVSIKENKETHPKDCECPECRCSDVPPTEGTGAPPAQKSDDKGCCCPDCKCFDCYKLKDTSAHTLDCKCGECLCKDCPKQMGQKGRTISAKPSEREPKTGVTPGGGSACLCGDCRCVDCYYKTQRAPAVIQCTCNPCLCVDCGFDHAAASESGAASKAEPAKVTVTASVAPADEAAIKSRSCHCVDCECDVCSDEARRKPRVKEQEVVAKASVANKSCHCVTCVCVDCIDTAMKATASAAQSSPKKGAGECNCTTCTCKDCTAKKAQSEEGKTEKKVDQTQSIQLPSKERSCKCMSCICMDCKKKPGAPDGTMEAKMSERKADVMKSSESKNTGKETYCKCITCTCSKCEPPPIVATGEPSTCQCETCQCENCTLKKTGEQRVTISAHVSQALPQPTAAAVQSQHVPSCKCATCECYRSVYTGEEKLIAKVDFGQSEISKPSKTPSAKQSQQAPPDALATPKIVSAKQSERLNTSESSHKPSHPPMQFTDPPPFEVPQKLPCDCRGCTCIICRKQVTEMAAIFQPHQGQSNEEAPPFEVPVRMPCICETCTCPSCVKEVRQPPSQPPVPQHVNVHKPLLRSALSANQPQPPAAGSIAQQPQTTAAECVTQQPPTSAAGSDAKQPPTSATVSFHQPQDAGSVQPPQPPDAGSVQPPQPPAAESFRQPSAPGSAHQAQLPAVVSAHQSQPQIPESRSVNVDKNRPVSAPPGSRLERQCNCPTCTCPEPTSTAPQVEPTRSNNVPGDVGSVKSSRHSRKTTGSTQESDHNPDCICEKCNCASEVIEVVDISTLDDESLRKKIQTDKQENCECREQIKEIKKALNRIKCACNEAEVKAYKSKPLVKQASAFGQTMSGLKIALSNLQEKCKAKDKMIEAMTGELKTRTSSNTLDKVLNTPIPEAPDYDKAEDVMTSPNAHGEPMTDILYSMKNGNVDKTFDSKISKAMETEKAYRGKSSKKPCRCGKSHKTKDNRSVNLVGFEVTDIRRITQDSIIIKWRPPKSNLITGYDIFVNGVNKSKVMSGGRTSAMIHSLDLTATIQITIYAVTKCGRCEPPAIAIYEIR